MAKQVKRFGPPAEGYAGLYVYRNVSFDTPVIQKDIWVNGECLGRSSAKTFFYKQYPGNKEYIISTESEFSPNGISLRLEAGKNYFIRQYTKMGLIKSSADLAIAAPEEAKKAFFHSAWCKTTHA